MFLSSDTLGALGGPVGLSEAAVLAELRWEWRTAFREQEEAWAQWCAGEGSHERFVAALDREQAAAEALAYRHRRRHAEGRR